MDQAIDAQLVQLVEAVAARHYQSGSSCDERIYQASVARAFHRLLSQNGFAVTLESLQASYEQILDYRFDDEWRLIKQQGRRKASGSFFTPAQLVGPLIEATVQSVLNFRVASRVFGQEDVTKVPPLPQWTPAQREAAGGQLLELRVCDPSCGPGVFLIAVAQRLADFLCCFRFPDRVTSPKERVAALADVVRQCIFGVDSDPVAIGLARRCLWMLAGSPPGRLSKFVPNLRCRDSLSVEINSETETKPQAGPICWESEFPEVFAAGGFDVTIGNPPFANAIEGGIDPNTKEHLGRSFPELRGTSDLAYYFLAMGDRLTKPDGAVGFVLPRGILTSPATRELRARLLHERPPSLIYAPQNPYLFPGAHVFVVALALHRHSVCLGSRDPKEPHLVPIHVTNVNWWAPLLEEAPLELPHDRRVGDRFEVFASMTTGMAYDLLPFITDDPVKDAPRLVTTGLIDPGKCYWGKRVCRYLKNRFQRPVVDVRLEIPAYVAGRLEKVRRPKVLIAGLSTRVEAFLDEQGIYCGAVSTYTILHPKDDIVELKRLCEFLNGKEATQRLQLELGAHAMGGGRITLTKSFLQHLPWPN